MLKMEYIQLVILKTCIMDGLKNRLPGLEFIQSDKLGIPSKYKEVILFALLAYLRLINKNTQIRIS